MKKIALILPWFGNLRNDFYFWMKSVEFNASIDFLMFTDQQIIAPPTNLKVYYTTLSYIEELAKKHVWEGCIISKPYKICDYKVTYGELFKDLLKDYDFWGHCDADLVFGDIRKFITDNILDRYDRIGVDGHLTLYRNIPEINSIYRNVDNIKEIFTNQKAFGFDEWGLNDNGTANYWMKHLNNKLWQEKFFDNLAPYHYSFIAGIVKKEKLGIKNLMYSYDNGKLYRYGTKNKDVTKQELLYVHLQKRPIYINTVVSNQFSIVPPGKFIPYVKKVTYSYLKWNIKDGKFWAYYIRARNKLNKYFGLKPYSNTVLLPQEDM